MTYQQWLNHAIEKLRLTATVTPKVDALVLLEEVTNCTRAEIMASPDLSLNSAEQQILSNWLLKRIEGEPIAYIIGEQEFWSLPFKVTNDTLIPRPDTEILVEQALLLIQRHFGNRLPISLLSASPLSILDLGTGTGAIALALAHELTKYKKRYHILGIDISPKAIEIAQKNAYINHISAVEFSVSDWFEQVQDNMAFNLIVSNPPYIAIDDVHLQEKNMQFEPLSALVANDAGLADLDHIITKSKEYLVTNGWLLVEHGWKQAEQVRLLFNQNGYQAIKTIRDYGGNERVTLACYR